MWRRASVLLTPSNGRAAADAFKEVVKEEAQLVTRRQIRTKVAEAGSKKTPHPKGPGQPPPPQPPANQGNAMRRLLIGGGTVVAGGLALQQAMRTDDELRAIKSLEDVERSHKELIKAAEEAVHAAEREAERKELIHVYAEAANEAITVANVDSFLLQLEDIKKLSRSGKLNPKYLEKLIFHCAEMGKVSFIRALRDNYDVDKLIQANEKARTLLAHPDADDIERLSGTQFWGGPGTIRDSGAQAYLEHLRERDLSDMEAEHTPMVTGIDQVADISAMLTYVKDTERERGEINGSYDRTVVLQLDATDPFIDFTNACKEAASKQTGTITFNFVGTGAHFTAGQLEVTHDGQGNFSVKDLYVDSLGNYPGCDAGITLGTAVKRSFPNAETKHLRAQLKQQHSDVGCSIFALEWAHYFVHADKLLDLPQYRDELPEEGKLMAYCELPENQTVKASGDMYLPEDEEHPVRYEYDLVTLPLAFSAEKQSINGKGIADVFDIRRSDLVHETCVARQAELVHRLRELNEEYQKANTSYSTANSWLTNPRWVRFSPEEVARRKARCERINEAQTLTLQELDEVSKDLYPYKGHQEFLLGHAGLKEEFKRSSERRQMEAHQPCKANDQKTFSERVKSYLRKSKQGRDQNWGRDKAIFKMAERLTQHMMSKPVGYAQEAGKSFGVDAFRQRHGLAVDETPTNEVEAQGLSL